MGGHNNNISADKNQMIHDKDTAPFSLHLHRTGHFGWKVLGYESPQDIFSASQPSETKPNNLTHSTRDTEVALTYGDQQQWILPNSP